MADTSADSFAKDSCASFAGGFVPAETGVIVTVSNIDGEEIAMVKTTAKEAPSSPREAVTAIAEAYSVAPQSVRVTVYVEVGGASGDLVCNP